MGSTCPGWQRSPFDGAAREAGSPPAGQFVAGGIAAPANRPRRFIDRRVRSADWLARSNRRGIPAPRCPGAVPAAGQTAANRLGRALRQVACVVATLAICLPSGLAQPAFLADPARFWQHESDYSGAEACEPCHPRISARQRNSNHARSLRAPDHVPELVFSLPFSVRDRVSGFALEMSSDPARGVRLRSEKGNASGEVSLEWAFGSGAKGITAIGRITAESWVESRLTWYESLGGIDFTTGASQYDPENAVESLGRGLTQQEVAECFGCHTTGFDARSSVPQGDELGIRCERCHGPGKAHAEAAIAGRPTRGTIFNPVTLGGFPQAQMCGACHGRPPQDNEFDALALLEQTPNSVRFPSQRIILSRCFNETFGELACTDCHDPHLDAADEGDSFDAACLSCHGQDSRELATVCPVASENCSSCHMPQERVMRHSMFSDHWIRVVRAE